MVSRKYCFPIFIVFVSHPLQKRWIEVSLYKDGKLWVHEGNDGWQNCLKM
jgi:hypothetical protein